MGLDIKARLVLVLGLAYGVCCCWNVNAPSSCVSVSVSVYISAFDVADYQPPPTLIMAGLAILAVPLIMRAVSHVTGAGDIASAAPAASMDVADIGMRPSPGCTVNNLVALDTTLNIALGDRRYILYFPVNYKPDTPAPLVLSYHGGTRVAEAQQALDLLTTTYFNQDYIIVYPNGINVSLSLVEAKE